MANIAGQSGLTITVEDGKWAKSLLKAMIQKGASILVSAKMQMFFIAVFVPSLIQWWFISKTFRRMDVLMAASKIEPYIAETMSTMMIQMVIALVSYYTLVGSVFTAVIVVRGIHQIKELNASTAITIEETKNEEICDDKS